MPTGEVYSINLGTATSKVMVLYGHLLAHDNALFWEGEGVRALEDRARARAVSIRVNPNRKDDQDMAMLLPIPTRNTHGTEGTHVHASVVRAQVPQPMGRRRPRGK